MESDYREMKRESFIDTYRAVLMFGICLLHSITQCGHNTAWAANMLAWCVPGFMFISGWFGIRFSIGKVLKLYGISFYCSIMYVAFDVVVSSKVADYNCVIQAYNIAIGQWFLNAYVIVMCLTPMVNLAVERMTIKEMCPLLVCVFGWSFATTLPVVNRCVPKSVGLTAYSFLTLLGVYIVARFTRRIYDGESGPFYKLIKKKKVVFLVVGICLIITAIGLGDYNSPFAIAVAGGIFFILKDCGIPVWLGRVCTWLGPSMFTVYLLHSHRHAFGYLTIVHDSLLRKGFSLVAAYLMTALIVFFLCVVADLPRRCVVAFCERVR